MSEFGSPSDEGSPTSNSRFELAMLEYSGPLLESCTKISRLGDPRNYQALANISYSSLMSMGKGVVCDAIPIFCSEFTADHLVQNLLDSEKQLEALRQSCNIPVHHEELFSEPPKGHVMFYTQILLTLGVKLPLHPWLQRMLSFIGYAPGQLYPGFWDTLIGFYIIWMEYELGEPSFHQWCYCYKMRLVKACTGYAECACRSERERIVFGKKKVYCTWKNRWCFLYNDWEYAKGVTPERLVPTHFQTAVTRGTIKLSGWELADIEKVLRVPKEDRHLGKLGPLFRKYVEKVGKKGETNAKKGKSPMLVPIDDILFHKGARRRSTIDKLGKPLDENESDRDRMMRLSSYLETTILEVSKVKWELDSALVEVFGLKISIPTERDAAVQEFLGSQAFHDAFRPHCIRAANFEKRKWMAILDRYDNGSIIRKYRDEIDEYRQKGEVFILVVDPNSDDDSDNEASISEQSQKSEDGPGDAEEGGDDDGVETQSDVVKGSASDEDDSLVDIYLDLISC
ncbi:unnamed protein product [Malus baccata var. baccata]